MSANGSEAVTLKQLKDMIGGGQSELKQKYFTAHTHNTMQLIASEVYNFAESCEFDVNFFMKVTPTISGEEFSCLLNGVIVEHSDGVYGLLFSGTGKKKAHNDGNSFIYVSAYCEVTPTTMKFYTSNINIIGINALYQSLSYPPNTNAINGAYYIPQNFSLSSMLMIGR